MSSGVKLSGDKYSLIKVYSIGINKDSCFLYINFDYAIFHSQEILKYPLAYNAIDKNYNVNRISNNGDYMVENGRPRYDISFVVL